jgi:hypothetical protein
MEEERLALRVKNESTGDNEPEYFENEITKENRMLEIKFEDLKKEIQEKSQMMEK